MKVTLLFTTIIQIHEDDVLELDDQPRWLKYSKVEEFQYPPRIKWDISYDEKKATSETMKFTLDYSGIQETVYSKSCDKKIFLHAKSYWFIDNHLSKQLCMVF